jgi:hypothetical protein
MKIQIGILVILIFIFGACDGDLLSVEETANVPVSTAPTVSAYLCPQDTVHTVLLSETSPVVGKRFSQAWNQNVGRSIVTLSDGDKTVTLKSVNPSSFTFTIKAEEFKVMAGKTYTLRVTTYDGQEAEATCMIPLNRVNIATADTKLVANTASQQKEYLVSWQDIAGEPNYYSVYVFQKIVPNKFEINNYVTIPSEDSENNILDTGVDGGGMITRKSFVMKPKINYTEAYEVTEIQILNTDEHF